MITKGDLLPGAVPAIKDVDVRQERSFGDPVSASTVDTAKKRRE